MNNKEISIFLDYNKMNSAFTNSNFASYKLIIIFYLAEISRAFINLGKLFLYKNLTLS